MREVYQSASMFRLKSIKVAYRRLGWPAGVLKYLGQLLGLTHNKERPWTKAELLLFDRWASQHPRRAQLKF